MARDCGLFPYEALVDVEPGPEDRFSLVKTPKTPEDPSAIVQAVAEAGTVPEDGRVGVPQRAALVYRQSLLGLGLTVTAQLHEDVAEVFSLACKPVPVSRNIGMVSDQGLEVGDRGSKRVLGLAIAVPILVETSQGGTASGPEEAVLGDVRVGAGDRVALGLVVLAEVVGKRGRD
jgi:hypothetical protein